MAINLKLAYQVELRRILELGTIAEVKKHTDWVNSVFPVKKSDGILFLFPDPMNFNKAIHRNQWYDRTIDDILSKLTTILVSHYWMLHQDFGMCR